METAFDQLDTPEEVVEQTAANKKPKNNRLEKIREDFVEEIKKNPELVEQIGTKSNTVEVVNSLAFGESGGLVKDKEKATKDKNMVESTSKVVGYVFVNHDKEPINIVVDAYDRMNKDSNGHFIPSKKTIAVAPGAKQALPAVALTELAARVEYSMTFANGKVIRGSAKVSDKDVLKAFYFAFNKDPETKKAIKTVHDDSVKINISKKKATKVNGVVTEKWTVLDNYFELFGFLENPPIKEEKEAKNKPNKDLSAAAVAHFVRNILAEDSK